VTASVPVTSDDTNVGTITTSPLVFSNSAVTVTTKFTPRTAGTAKISVGTPAGFSTPANYTQITATVNAPNITVPNVTVGRDLQTSVGISLAVTPPSPVTVTVTSSNPDLVLIAPDSTSVGTSTVTFSNVTGTFAGTVYVQGLLDQGSVSIIAQAAGYNDGSGSVVLGASGFIIDPRYLSSINTTAQAANTTVRITAARLDSFGNLAAYQALRGGLNVSVPVTSSNTAVGVITTSPVDFPGGSSTVATEFDPVAVGSTVISVLPPVGSPFSTPSNYQKITATVQ